MNGPAVRRAEAADRPLVERLWQLFRHDMSEFQVSQDLPGPDGRYGQERLEAAFDDTADRVPYLLARDEQPVGFAFVRGLAAPVRVMNSFFVIRGARRSGLGLPAAVRILELHPGRWGIPFQDANSTAVRFWRRVATRATGDEWTEEHRAVPDRLPGVPPDTWISLTMPATAGRPARRLPDDRRCARGEA
ncbi:GNAT family N-acetyltransferase [Streptomyces sp. TR06-5]|uniref:GNAT family N-acetyltransferase n=1 Tax=unclassified Streptomyces TaxID=2593676 RepID=UPI0039A31055